MNTKGANQNVLKLIETADQKFIDSDYKLKIRN